MRRIAKTDANQSLIVRALRDLGASVCSLAQVGNGCPDLAVGWRGRTYLFEVKDGNQPPSKRKLTPDEIAWHASWNGHVDVIESVDDALKILCE